MSDGGSRFANVAKGTIHMASSDDDTIKGFLMALENTRHAVDKVSTSG
jgi:hypothetical protein